MSSIRSRYVGKSWKKGSHFISTDPALIPIPQLITVFDSDEVYWTRSLPAEAMKEMLESSLVFSLHECPPEPDEKTTEQPSTSPSPTRPDIQSDQPTPADLNFIGLARCVTDYTTFVYLTDVWVDPAHQGFGLGRWLISVVQEVIESMPYLRRSMLNTGDWQRSVPFYEKLMNMQVLETKLGEGLAVMERKGPRHPSNWR